jgi:hypothetical protein
MFLGIPWYDSNTKKSVKFWARKGPYPPYSFIIFLVFSTLLYSKKIAVLTNLCPAENLFGTVRKCRTQKSSLIFAQNQKWRGNFVRNQKGSSFGNRFGKTPIVFRVYARYLLCMLYWSRQSLISPNQSFTVNLILSVAVRPWLIRWLPALDRKKFEKSFCKEDLPSQI